MATGPSPDITCPSCGKHFKSKPEYAGKTLRCMCGHSIHVANATPPPPLAGERGLEPKEDPDEGLYDLAPEAPAAKTSVEPPRMVSAPIRPSGTHGTGTSAPKAHPHVDAGSAKAGSAFRAMGIPAHRPPPPDEGVGMKRVLVVFLGLCVLVGLIFGARVMFKSSQVPGKALPGDDGRVAKATDAFGATEAKEWFTASDRRSIIGAYWTREKAIKMIDQWYAEGAKKVLAFGGAVTSSLAIELPDSGPQRKAFIDYAEQWRIDHHFQRPPVTDVHQKYVMIDFM